MRVRKYTIKDIMIDNMKTMSDSKKMVFKESVIF